MNLSAPTTITLRRPSADADLIISRHGNATLTSDLIISRHDDAVGGSQDDRTRCDVITARQVSYSDPGSASASSAGEDAHNSLLDCSGRESGKKKKKKKRRAEERWRWGVRRASDCLRDVIKPDVTSSNLL